MGAVVRYRILGLSAAFGQTLAVGANVEIGAAVFAFARAHREVVARTEIE
jgi:hypothetical protein